jgi:REase_DpnII-MboI
VVLVNDLIAHSFGVELSRLERLLAESVVSLSPATALASHIYKLACLTPPLKMRDAEAKFPKGPLEEAPQLALAGYSMTNAAPTADELGRWREGLRRLSRRDAFPRDHQTFAFRPTELVGLALGVKASEGNASKLYEWLIRTVESVNAKANSSLWNCFWNGYAAFLLGSSSPAIDPIRLDELDDAELAAVVILRSAGLSFFASGDSTRIGSTQAEVELLRRVIFSNVEDRDVDRLAAVRAGLQLAVGAQLDSHLVPIDDLTGGTRGALRLLERICRRFDHFVRSLQKRHAGRPTYAVTDEYDVQDLVHAILLLHFDVIIPEDAVPARAGNKSRLDFLLKRERVVVETKMTRKGLDQSAAHDELIADRDRYKAHPDCDVLVCLVYDPARIFHNPAAFEHDLNSDTDRPRMRAFVCPL